MAAYWSDMCDRQTCVYRLYDGGGRLLYVGLSNVPRDRIPTHRRKTWGHEIASQTVEWFSNRDAAKDAERQAIAHENPLHNIVRPAAEGART